MSILLSRIQRSQTLRIPKVFLEVCEGFLSDKSLFYYSLILPFSLFIGFMYSNRVNCHILQLVSCRVAGFEVMENSGSTTKALCKNNNQMANEWKLSLKDLSRSYSLTTSTFISCRQKWLDAPHFEETFSSLVVRPLSQNDDQADQRGCSKENS